MLWSRKNPYNRPWCVGSPGSLDAHFYCEAQCHRVYINGPRTENCILLCINVCGLFYTEVQVGYKVRELSPLELCLACLS